jgi:hypothetical protein
MLIIGSPSYLSALEDDLADAASLMGGTDRLVIISGEPGPRREELRGNWIASAADLLPELGGALPSLHARLARRLLDDAPAHGLDASRLRSRWQQFAARAPRPVRIERAVSTDSQVKSFIRDGLQRMPSLTHTRALRDFRAGGCACEQGRFRELFRSVQLGRAR